MKEVNLPSGKILRVGLAPFADSKALYQSILIELKGIKAEAKQEIDTNFIKDILCSILSSGNVDRTISKCMDRCLYGGLKIDAQTFEPEENRQDYIIVLQEVAWSNIEPFLKGLSVPLKDILGMKISSQQ
jgi:hypothetical protein